MEWPSKRIPLGGIMHPAKVKYDPEIKKMLNVLVQESNMSIQQRQKSYFLRSGDSMPKLTTTSKVTPVIFRPGSSKRRSKHTIQNSGAYERDKFQPQLPKVDRQVAIQELQDKMTYGVEKDPEKICNKRKMKHKENGKDCFDNRFNELAKEIKERSDWLEEMKALGQGFKYKDIIEHQIQEKVRLMEKLKLESSN